MKIRIEYTRSITLAAVLLLASVGFSISAFAQVPPKLTPDEAVKWREDLKFLADLLPAKHKNLFHRLDRQVYEKAVSDLDAKIPSLTKHQVGLEFERIVALARDGHTWLNAIRSDSMGVHAFPIGLYVFEDGVFVVNASPRHKELVGSRILKIGGKPVDQVIEKIAPYISSDNEMGVKSMVPRYLVSPEVLYALGITSSATSAMFEIEKNSKISSTELAIDERSPRSIASRPASDWIDAADGSPNPKPLTIKNMAERYWFEHLPDKKLLYVQLNEVQNGANKTIEQFFAEVFELARRNDIEKFVLDIRHNGGGNNTLIKPIIRGLIKLDKIDQRGHLFVIIGRRTFSAAQNLTNELETWTNAVFVGEPTGSHVNMYGDARRFELPNSKLFFQVSELWWQNKHARDERKWTAPELAAELRFSDYANNIDPAMQAILNYKPSPKLGDMAAEAIRTGQIKEFLAKAATIVKDPLYKYQVSEEEINRFGYALLGMKRIDDAISAFELNAGLYPNSANVFDSLGEAYMAQGSKDLAIKNYKRSLELNPRNTGAKERLKKFEQP